MLIGGSTNSGGILEGSRSAASEAKLEEDLNRFLTLLVTQLQNQDPLDPLDANEFTSQLVQFAGVEQQIFQNANLEKLLALQETNQISSLVDFIGTTVEAEGNELPLENGLAEFTYTMPTSANTATIPVYELPQAKCALVDPSGCVLTPFVFVTSLSASALASGWNAVNT